MNLIDLRGFKFQRDKLMLFQENQIIFSSIESEQEGNKLYFCWFEIETKNIYKINTIGIDICKNSLYTTCILGNYIYISSYREQGGDEGTVLHRLNIGTGQVEELYCIKKHVKVIFLDQRYALFNGSKFETDEKHWDLKKEINGEYNYAILCDFIEKKEYLINDKRIILGLRDHFIPYDISGTRYIVFEESYMEDWELETMFRKNVKKEDFYRNGYRESINIISLYGFVESVIQGYQEIPFKQIYKTELTGWTRYFGMDRHNIYYRVKDFENNIEWIYSFNKQTLESKLLKSIQIDNKEHLYSDKSIMSMYYDLEDRKIYKIDHSKKRIKEILDESLEYSYNRNRESFEGVIGDCCITSFWKEDDQRNDYRVFVKIKNIKNKITDIYEGVCMVVKDNVVLFK